MPPTVLLLLLALSTALASQRVVVTFRNASLNAEGGRICVGLFDVCLDGCGVYSCLPCSIIYNLIGARDEEEG
jgi:hypothetical protein